MATPPTGGRLILTWLPWIVGLGFAAFWGVGGLVAGLPLMAGFAAFWVTVLVVARDAIGRTKRRLGRVSMDVALSAMAFVLGWEGGLSILPAAAAFLVADLIDPTTPGLPTGRTLGGRGLKLLAGGVVALIAAVVLGGPLYSTASASATAVGAPNLGISNGTPLTVALYVNGQHVLDAVPGHAPPDLDESTLPPLPWSVEARSPSGRLLTAMLVEPGSVATWSNGAQGVLGRVDLSCGRLTIWAGDVIPSGPIPPASPGAPGDCVP